MRTPTPKYLKEFKHLQTYHKIDKTAFKIKNNEQVYNKLYT